VIQELGVFAKVQRTRFGASEAGTIPMNRVDGAGSKDGDAGEGKKPRLGLRGVKFGLINLGRNV